MFPQGKFQYIYSHIRSILVYIPCIYLVLLGSILYSIYYLRILCKLSYHLHNIRKDILHSKPFQKRPYHLGKIDKYQLDYIFYNLSQHMGYIFHFGLGVLYHSHHSDHLHGGNLWQYMRYKLIGQQLSRSSSLVRIFCRLR